MSLADLPPRSGLDEEHRPLEDLACEAELVDHHQHGPALHGAHDPEHLADQLRIKREGRRDQELEASEWLYLVRFRLRGCAATAPIEFSIDSTLQESDK